MQRSHVASGYVLAVLQACFSTDHHVLRPLRGLALQCKEQNR